MPELPEVRTVATGLNKSVVGLKVVNVENFTPKLIWRNDENWFIENIKNKTIKSVYNYGKYLVFDLKDFKMISHLRMEGKWTVSEIDKYFYPISHLRIEFELSNKKYLRYFDSRKFGTLELWSNNEYMHKSGIDRLGPEPLYGKLTFDYLKEKTLKKRVKIKPFLLDQSIVCGIGNIYVNEILFAAKIAPDRLTNELSDLEIKDIIKYSEIIIEKAIDMKGSSIHSYKSGEGVSGQFQNELKVHLREGENCFICQRPIIKTQIGGRGTYFCTNCQK